MLTYPTQLELEESRLIEFLYLKGDRFHPTNNLFDQLKYLVSGWWYILPLIRKDSSKFSIF